MTIAVEGSTLTRIVTSPTSYANAAVRGFARGLQ
jgi:hypothetical protein